MNTYYVLGPGPGKDASLTARSPQGHNRVPLGVQGVQRGGQLGRQGEEERGQVQGQTSWLDDLENHFPFPCLRAQQRRVRTGLPAQRPALDGQRPGGTGTPSTHAAFRPGALFLGFCAGPAVLAGARLPPRGHLAMPGDLG